MCWICCSYGSVANSKTIKNSRLVSQKDDVHVCIMCLRAIMNYQVPGTTYDPRSDMSHKLGAWYVSCAVKRWTFMQVFSPHPLCLSVSPCSTVSIWSCLMHMQSMKLLSAWTIRTHGKNSGPHLHKSRAGPNKRGNPAANSYDMLLRGPLLLSEGEDQRCTHGSLRECFLKGDLW